MYQITFQFENGGKPVIVDAAPNTSLLDVAKAANVAIDAPCNGNGSCGKCRVKILEGTVDSTPTHHISEEDYAAGWRLSCASKPTSDVVVQVPDIASAYQSRMKTADLSTGEEVATFNKLQEDIREAGVDISCDFVSAVLELSEPTLDDTMPDTERLALAAQDAFDGCTEVKLTYHTVKKLAKTLRDANFKVQIAGTLDMGVLTVMDVTGKLDAPMIGCAIDIGTTTVTGVLLNLETGEVVAKASSGNGQIRYGADVINRIIEQSKPGGVKRLQDAILKETLVPLTAVMCKSAGITANRILRAAVASNTTMNHLLLGVDANPVRMEPYIPTFFQWRGMVAKDLGFVANPDAEVLVAPNIDTLDAGVPVLSMHAPFEVVAGRRTVQKACREPSEAAVAERRILDLLEARKVDTLFLKRLSDLVQNAEVKEVAVNKSSDQILRRKIKRAAAGGLTLLRLDPAVVDLHHDDLTQAFMQPLRRGLL